MTHPDDAFHPPSGDDPFWTETCWFTFAVPEPPPIASVGTSRVP